MVRGTASKGTEGWEWARDRTVACKRPRSLGHPSWVCLGECVCTWTLIAGGVGALRMVVGWRVGAWQGGLPGERVGR